MAEYFDPTRNDPRIQDQLEEAIKEYVKQDNKTSGVILCCLFGAFFLTVSMWSVLSYRTEERLRSEAAAYKAINNELLDWSLHFMDQCEQKKEISL